MGPTASGKTDIALRLASELPVELISVDSALVYRGMNVGTAKPDVATLQRVPHRLIDICEPETAYSAGAFVRDASAAIGQIRKSGRIPLLVGGTMMYFRALTRGMATLPHADPSIRAAINAEATRSGWRALHEELCVIDPAAGRRNIPNDSQRIQRALEVFRVSGKSLSAWQKATPAEDGSSFLRIALETGSRSDLHQRIALRFKSMMKQGFVDEVRTLRGRPGLSAGSTSMRAVGYRQLWSHLAGEYDLGRAEEKALAATRQLAKRQLTWLRAEPLLHRVDALDKKSFGAILKLVDKKLAQ
jgi:tRNA dimethylallyltransferase